MANLSKDATNMPPKGVETRFTKNGSLNPKYKDLLDEDKPVAGQKYVCISFVSPEKIIEKKELYYFQDFLKQWDLSKSFEKYTQFMHYLSYKHNIKFDDLNSDLLDFCEEEKDRLFTTNLSDDYKNFIDAHDERLEKEFSEAHDFQTNVRGVKVRGSYPSQEEAELRCKMLREVDPDHDVYVGPVGLWMPYHPEAYRTGRVEYLEDELNQLMHEKTKNESAAKLEFEKRLKDTKAEAMKDNERKAIESGNVLTQTIDNKGELVNVKDIDPNNADANEVVAVADLRRELFEGDNVVMSKDTDHGLSDILKRQAEKKVLTIEEVTEATEATATEASDNVKTKKD